MDNTVCSLVRRLFLPLLLPLLFACGLFMTAQAQITYLANESFKKSLPQGWSVQPASTAMAPTWASETKVCASEKYAMHGYVPYNEGDTVELVSPYYDCSNYKYVMLKFSHICKVLGSDLCQVMYQEQGIGGYYKWRVIPSDAYKGNSSNYSRSLAFTHEDYSIWRSADTFAIANSAWWQQETFDVSEYACYTSVRFKFVMTKGSYFASFVADGWYIDDFQVLASNSEMIFPEVSFISSYMDTVYSTGPYEINAKVATRTSSRIVRPYLHYTVTANNVSRQDSILMNDLDGGDSLWTVTIPQQVFGTQVDYYITGKDVSGNMAQINGSFYAKMATSRGFQGYSVAGDMSSTSTTNAAPFRSNLQYSYSRMLYTAAEVAPDKGGGLITKIAFPLKTNNTNVLSKQSVYMQVVTDSVTASRDFVDPRNNGAVRVWAGSCQADSAGWIEITLDKSFTLPPDKNLMVYWFNEQGVTKSVMNFVATNTKPIYRAVWVSNSTQMPSSAGTLLDRRPNARFYVKNLRNDSNAAAMVSVDNPLPAVSSGKQAVKATIRNKGLKNLRTARIGWSVNGVLQPVKNYTGNLSYYMTDTVTVGTYMQRGDCYDTVVVWVSQPNNALDSLTHDDTLRAIAYGCDSAFSGVYTVGVGKTFDFSSLPDALHKFSMCRTKGDVTLRLASGVYEEAWDFTGYSNGLDGHRLTVTSMAAHADSVVIRPKSGTPLTLGNSALLAFKDLTFSADTSKGRVVYFTSNCHDIAFEHCVLKGCYQKNTGNTYACVASANVQHQNLSFVGNRILGGSVGIMFNSGSNSAHNTGMVFDSNHIAGSYYYPIYLYYCDAEIMHNTIEEAAEAVNSTFHGMYLYYMRDSRIEGNRIRLYGGTASTRYGIYAGYLDSTVLLCNNEIMVNNNDRASYGLYANYHYGSRIVNNSIYLQGAAATSYTFYGIYHSNGFGAIRNNLVVIDSSVKAIAYPLWMTNNATNIARTEVDYNCWYAPVYVAYVGKALASLADFQTAVPSATHDVSLFPVYTDKKTCLRLYSYANLYCNAYPGVSNDLEGKLRVMRTVSGCYTNTLDSVNMAVAAILGYPALSYQNDTVKPYVVIMNAGLLSQTNATIQWSVNGVDQASVQWKGSLVSEATDTVFLGSYAMKAGQNVLQVCLKDNALHPSFVQDDTLRATNYTCQSLFNGTYTVGSNGYFASLQDALHAMSLCGMGGNVTLQLIPGTYVGNFSIPVIAGSDTNHRLIITSLTGKAEDVVLQRADNGQQNAAPIIIENVSHVDIKNITLSAVSVSSSPIYSYAHTIMVLNNSSDITVSHCRLLMPLDSGKRYGDNATFSNVYVYGNRPRNVQIDHNTMVGGRCGFYLYISNWNRNIRYIRMNYNNMTQMDQALYVYWGDSLEFIGNTVVQRTEDITPVSMTGVYINGGTANIENNVFEIPSLGNGMDLGLNSDYSGVNSSNYNRICNNEIRGVFTSSTGHGIWIRSNKAKVYHNSLNIEGSAANTTAYGIHVNSAGDVRNNIICLSAQTETSYPVAVESVTNNVYFDYNCYYNPSSPYIAPNIVSLPAWQAKVQGDAHSVINRPFWQHADRNLELVSEANLACPALPEVPMDMLGTPHDSLTNMGCYIVHPDTVDAALMDFVGIEEAFANDSIPVGVVLVNAGTKLMDSVRIVFEVDGNTACSMLYRPATAMRYLQQDTVAFGKFVFTKGKHTFRAYVRCKGDRLSDDDTVSAEKTLYGHRFAGTFIVGNSAQADFKADYIPTFFSDMKYNGGAVGDITLAFESGSYNCSINLSDAVAPMGVFYSLTLTSLAQNRDSVQISGTSTLIAVASNNANIKIEHLTLLPAGQAISMAGGCKNIGIRHNAIIADTSNSNSTLINITRGGTSNLYIANNMIQGGGTGISIDNEVSHGYPASLTIYIDSNVIWKQKSKAIYLGFTVPKRLGRNTIESGYRNTSWIGLQAFVGCFDTIVSNVFNQRSSHINSSRAISIEDEEGDLYLNYGVVACNNVFNRCYVSTVLDYSEKPSYIYNNTFFNPGDYCLYISEQYSGLDRRIRGNIFYGGSSSKAVIAGDKQYTLDYNCYYSISTVRYTADKHGVYVRPVFIDSTRNFSVEADSALMMPRSITGVMTDVLGLQREPVTSMGAYTILSAKDLSMTGLAGVSALNSSGSSPLYAIVKNVGGMAIDSSRINLYLNGVQQKTVFYKPVRPLMTTATDTVLLGRFVPQDGPLELVAFVQMAGDMISANDSIRIQTYICKAPLSGTYTVCGANADFSTLEDMKMSLKNCGVSGPVVMKLRAGTYNTLSLDFDIPGGNNTNTVTFMPDNGTVVFDGGASNAGIVLQDIRHVIFQNLTFGNVKDGLIGTQLIGKLVNVTFRNCNIYASTTATGSTCQAVGFVSFSNSADYPEEVKFIGNRIRGGYANFYCSYVAGNATQLNRSSIYLDSNEMTDAFRYGLYANYYMPLSSFCSNVIRNRSDRKAVYSGVHISFNSNIGSFNGNRIRISNDTTAYGLYFDQYQNQTGNGLSNNEIIVVGSSIHYGIYYNSDNSNIQFHHNSVYVVSENSTAYGMWWRVGSVVHYSQFTRNLVVCKGKNNCPLYFYTVWYGGGSGLSKNFSLREWNNIYSKDVLAVNQGTSVTFKSIASLQQASGDNDSNSISVNPVFANPDSSLALKSFDSLACYMHPDVPYDINGKARTSLTTMGAYSRELYDDRNLALTSFSSPENKKDVVCYRDYTPVSFFVRNPTYTAVSLDSSIVRLHLEVTGAATYSKDTILTHGTLNPLESMPVDMGFIPTFANGDYHITVVMRDSLDADASDDTLGMVYKVYRTDLPFDVDFSTVPVEFVNVTKSGDKEWQVAQGGGTNPDILPAFGTGRLEFAGADHPGYCANAVFNSLSLKNCVNPRLSFWYAHTGVSEKRDMMIVLATTDGGATYTEIGRVVSTDTGAHWQQYDIDLSRFANEDCMSLVFQAFSFGSANQSLDRVRITADVDAGIALLPMELTSACNNDQVPLKVAVTNLTKLNMEFTDDTIRAEVTGATTHSFSYVYNKQLGGYETDTVTLGNMDLRTNGNYYINLCMQSQDDNALNDTVSDSTLYIWQDIAIDSIIGIDAQTEHPGGDTVWVSALVRNRSNLEADRFTLRMSLNGALVVEDTVYAPLSAGDTMTHTMSLPYVVPFADKEQPFYFLELTVTLPCDGDNTNDLRSMVGAVHVPDTVDLQVLSIARPADTLGRKKVSPVVRLANIGNADVQDVMLHVEVLDSAQGLLDKISETVNFIRSNDTAEHAFALTYSVPDYDGRYWLRAYVERHADDLEPGNDTLMAQFSCKRNNIGIARHDGEGWNLGQNEPNPASGVTAIPFNVPSDGRVVLSVMGVNGQLLHREEIDATAGANRVELQLETLPAGLYYYSLEYRGQRQVRKMTVIK